MLDDDDAAAQYKLAKAGALSFSIGGMILDKHRSPDGDVVTQIDLIEVSLTPTPVQAGAIIETVKSFDTRKTFEHATREKLGLSRTQAKRLAAGGYNALVAPNDDELPDELASAITKHLTEVAQVEELAMQQIERSRNAEFARLQHMTFNPVH